MHTFLHQPIKEDTRGILYLCHYDPQFRTIEVLRELQFTSEFKALEAYANIPNPESQIASGATQEELKKDLIQLHRRLNDPDWVRDLENYL